jgi:hypothetical protein
VENGAAGDLRSRRNPGGSHAPAIQFVYLAVLGIGSSAIAYVAWAKAYSLVERTSQVSNYMFVTPFLASLFGFVFAGEGPGSGDPVRRRSDLIGVLIFQRGKAPKKADMPVSSSAQVDRTGGCETIGGTPSRADGPGNSGKGGRLFMETSVREIIAERFHSSRTGSFPWAADFTDACFGGNAVRTFSHRHKAVHVPRHSEKGIAATAVACPKRDT